VTLLLLIIIIIAAVKRVAEIALPAPPAKMRACR